MLKIKWLKTIGIILLYLIVISAFVFLHELSHCVTCELFEGRCSGIGFDWNNFYAYNFTGCGSIECWRITTMAGSLIAGTVSAFIRDYSRYKEYLHLYICCSVYFLGEIFFWGYSPIMEHGDAYSFFQSFNEVDLTLYYVMMFSVLIYLSIKTLVRIIQMVKRNGFKKRFNQSVGEDEGFLGFQHGQTLQKN